MPVPNAARGLTYFGRYTISWQRSLPDVSLDGVEYKCLPSGLHSVQEDLVYFIQGAYAGVSAFVQGTADEQHRNASFVAIGALVPLSYGRLGKSWLHAAELRRLAGSTVKDIRDVRALELFWKDRRQDEAADDIEAPTPSVVRRMSLPPGLERKRKRAQSQASVGIESEHGIAADHPALSMLDFLYTFGPLIFPLYRSALLRKRVLLLGPPPVQTSCNFVYDLSILSSVPPNLNDVVQPDSENLLRIQSLFNVGIHDIPYLSEQKRKARWLACTTDDILREKHQLYDILVSLPTDNNSTRTTWPRIHTAEGTQLKATQRDLRRYRLLRADLDHERTPEHRYRDHPNNEDNESEIASLIRAPTEALLHEVKQTQPGESELVEPASWAAMAYNGIMWWASAGEMEAWETEELRTDRELLEEIPDSEDLLRHISSPSSADDDNLEQLAMRRASAIATVMNAYFHRLTAQILQSLADIVEEADDETEEGIAESVMSISADDIRAMGLDSWSSADREFAKEAMGVYFGREAKIEEGGRRICGVKIC